MTVCFNCRGKGREPLNGAMTCRECRGTGVWPIPLEDQSSSADEGCRTENGVNAGRQVGNGCGDIAHAGKAGDEQAEFVQVAGTGVHQGDTPVHLPPLVGDAEGLSVHAIDPASAGQPSSDLPVDERLPVDAAADVAGSEEIHGGIGSLPGVVDELLEHRRRLQWHRVDALADILRVELDKALTMDGQDLAVGRKSMEKYLGKFIFGGGV